MSRSLLPALALLVAGLVPAACSGTAAPTAAPSGVVASDAGTAGAGSASAGASPSGSGSASGTSRGTTNVGCAQGVRGGDVMLTERDNGGAVCLARGAALEVYLHAATGEEWTKPTADRGVLVPAVSGKGALPIGVSAGFFTAATPGQTRVTAQLLPCRGPKPGPMCDVVASFQVSVIVPG